MDSEERKKSAKLIRKSSNASYVKKRIFKNRLLASKAVSKAQKHLAPLAASGQTLEFSPEMLKTCAEINAITAFAPEEHTYLQKHLRHLTLSLIHRTIRIMEQNKRGMPQISDIDFAAQNMGLEPTSPQNPPPDFLRRMAQLAGTQKNLLNASEGPPALPQPSQTKPEDAAAASASAETASKQKDPIPASLSHPRVMQAAIIEVSGSCKLTSS
ncbi:unnamed protein product [Dibothriocephalus latus]|uniref:Uncharacterized protein n=1 Tax=Dibothriocephalus latus TaxID=60516 RepID=A0A3P7NXE6_DIBLA|nr:unnamed protein product [Dibothriocephalus latus]